MVERFRVFLLMKAKGGKQQVGLACLKVSTLGVLKGSPKDGKFKKEPPRKRQSQVLTFVGLIHRREGD